MNRFLKLSTEEQRTFIMEAAARRGISPVIIEKDFWVCLALEKLFQSKFAEKKHLITANNTENNCLCGEYKI